MAGKSYQEHQVNSGSKLPKAGIRFIVGLCVGLDMGFVSVTWVGGKGFCLLSCCACLLLWYSVSSRITKSIELALMVWEWVGELALRAREQESWPCSLLPAAVGELSGTVPEHWPW